MVYSTILYYYSVTVCSTKMRVYHLKERNIRERKFCGKNFFGIIFWDLQLYSQKFLPQKWLKNFFLRKTQQFSKKTNCIRFTKKYSANTHVFRAQNIFCSGISMRHFNFFMKMFNPVCYFDTVILIFCYFLSYLLYHFTSLVLIGNTNIFFSLKLWQIFN